MSNIVVTGSGAGLGRALCNILAMEGHTVVGLTLDPKGDAVCFKEIACDVTDEIDIRHVYHEDIPFDTDVLINCAGINRIGMLESFDEQDWDDVMDTNAKSIYLMTQAFLPALSGRAYSCKGEATNGYVMTNERVVGGTVVNIVSNASHMPMTGSAAYNASKGAAHILTLQLARELTKRHGVTVFGISPNKLAGTDMSTDIERQVCETRGWTPEFARQYQLNALLTGEETDPLALARFIAYLLQSKENHKYLTGCVIPYGA